MAGDGGAVVAVPERIVEVLALSMLVRVIVVLGVDCFNGRRVLACLLHHNSTIPQQQQQGIEYRSCIAQDWKAQLITCATRSCNTR